jgi:outer membrane protein, heavy metal efflux system
MPVKVRGAAFALSLVVAVFARPSLCAAQTRLSMQDAIDQAMRSRAMLKAEAERVAVAQGDKLQAGARPNPSFQFGNENLRPGQTYTRDVDTLAFFTWPLDVLGKRASRLEAATRTVNRTEAELDLVRRQVTFAVKRAYWNARGAQERRDLLRSTVDTFQQIVDYHAAQLKVGTIAEQDLLRVQLEGERIQIAAHLAEVDADNARVQLMKEIGTTGLGTLLLTEPLDVSSGAVTVAAPEDALAARPELKVAAAAVEEARAKSRLQDVAARPDLEVVFGYKRTQLPDSLTGVNTAIAGFKVTIPVLDRNQGNRLAAVAELRRQEQLRTEAENIVRTDLQRALDEYQTRRVELVQTLQPLREHAQTISGIAQAAYRQGGVELLRLLDAERSRLDAESAWVDGMVAFQQSVVNLEVAQGVSR